MKPLSAKTNSNKPCRANSLKTSFYFTKGTHLWLHIYFPYFLVGLSKVCNSGKQTNPGNVLWSGVPGVGGAQ